MTFVNTDLGNEVSLNVPPDGRLSPRQVRDTCKALCPLPGTPGVGVIGQVPVIQRPPETEPIRDGGVEYVAVQRPLCASCGETLEHQLTHRGEARLAQRTCVRCGAEDRDILVFIVPAETVTIEAAEAAAAH